MLRLLAFLVTGFWPSAKSLLALNRRVDALEQRLTTLTKKHNTLAGSYYADPESAGEGSPGADAPDFPEAEFRDQLAAKRGGLTRSVGDG
jgi:hypothetical protein